MGGTPKETQARCLCYIFLYSVKVSGWESSFQQILEAGAAFYLGFHGLDEYLVI
jgi:hypothetical protein